VRALKIVPSISSVFVLFGAVFGQTAPCHITQRCAEPLFQLLKLRPFRRGRFSFD
jgi:hypothetical protein